MCQKLAQELVVLRVPADKSAGIPEGCSQILGDLLNLEFSGAPERPQNSRSGQESLGGLRGEWCNFLQISSLPLVYTSDQCLFKTGSIT